MYVAILCNYTPYIAIYITFLYVCNMFFSECYILLPLFVTQCENVIPPPKMPDATV